MLYFFPIVFRTCLRYRYRFIFGFTLIALQQGCIFPDKFEGYIPSGQGELLDSNFVGIKYALRIPITNEVSCTVIAVDNDLSSTVELDIRLTVPEGNTVQFQSPNLMIESINLGKRLILPMLKILGSTSGQHSPTAVLKGVTTIEKSFFRDYRVPELFLLSFKEGPLFATSIPSMPSFVLHFPKLRINDDTYQIDPVKFDSYRSWGVYVGGIMK